MDVDGVLTDGGLLYGPDGVALKRFDVRDGMGVTLLHEAGVLTAMVSADEAEATAARAAKLGVRVVKQGVGDKAAAVAEVLAECGVPGERAAYVGDDVSDLPAFARVGVSVAVPQAPAAVRSAAQLVTDRPGGAGAVREVCDAILAGKRAGSG